MRAVFQAVVVLVPLVRCCVLLAAPVGEPKPLGIDQGLFPYRFERGSLHYEDAVTLANGAKRTGKLLEWGNQILLFDAGGGMSVFSIPDVKLFETRRSARHNERPDLPDLTVAYVERLPRDPSWHGHVVKTNASLDIDPNQAPWHPAVGSQVTFRAHILNAGRVDSAAVAWRALIDEQSQATGRLATLAPGKEALVEFSWPWQQGQHRLRIEIDPRKTAPEFLRWNNTFIEPIRALGVSVVVARDRYQRFRGTPNLVDSFCFEDYLQYQLRNMNALFAASVYPSAPRGVIERVRCDRIIVVDDPADAQEASRWRSKLRRGGKGDGLAEYAALLTLGRLSKDEDPVYDALKVDWRLLQELGLQLGLVDLRKTDTTIGQCYVLDKNERFAQRRFISPSIRTLMYSAGGFPLAEEQACFLNKTLGRPRGLQGDYLYQLPEKIVLEVLANDGTPREDVQVDAFQLMSSGPEAGRITGVGRSDPLFSTISDAAGRALLANLPAGPSKTPGGYALRPNPFGRIATDGSNGLLLLRMRSEGAEEFHFLPLSTCNVAFLRGHRHEYVHRVATRFGPVGAPPPPPHAAARMTDRSDQKPPLTVTWVLPKDYEQSLFEEVRIYKRTSFAGDGIKPWTLVSIKKPPLQGPWLRQSEETYFDEFQYDGPYALDTFFAATIVDKQGRESSLSERAYIPYGKQCVAFAIDRNAAYITVRGDGTAQMLYWDGVAGTQPFGLKSGRFRDYRPAFAGVAITQDQRLIVTDPQNHVLAVYDLNRHSLMDVIPKRDAWPGLPSEKPGEFADPADVAVDDEGNIYVADRGNHRVQVLDSKGRFIGLLDEDFRFEGPHALGYANGHLCVTDKAGTRCRVYKIENAQAQFVRQLPALVDADRGVVNLAGKVFITGRTSEDDKWAVQEFTPQGKTAEFAKAVDRGRMGGYHRPRGLYWYRGASGNFAYFVNDFPFDVRRVDLRQ